MIEKIFDTLYRVEVPLPENPLKALNSYIIMGDGRFLIIDTGLNREECKNAMTMALNELQVDLNKTDFFLTHLHADHSGLIGDLVTNSAKVYFNKKEFSAMLSDKRWQALYAFFISNGFPHDEFMRAMDTHPGHRYGLDKDVDFYFLEEGNRVEIGDYSFECIATPGHSPSHMCLYEANKKILISGDHILLDITPNITHWPELGNSLKFYLSSLEKIYSLDIDIVLPGHRRIWNDHRQRIKGLQEHHKTRLTEVVAALQDGEKTAFQIAPYIKWDIGFKTWEEFPPAQKWFAVGETIAHIYYLEEQEILKRRIKEDKVWFLLNK